MSAVTSLYMLPLEFNIPSWRTVYVEVYSYPQNIELFFDTVFNVSYSRDSFTKLTFFQTSSFECDISMSAHS